MATKEKNLIEFNFIQPSLFKNKIKQDCAIKRDLARAVNLKKKLNFFSCYSKYGTINGNKCVNALHNTNYREVHISTLMGFCKRLITSTLTLHPV